MSADHAGAKGEGGHGGQKIMVSTCCAMLALCMGVRR
jgi:hypothetical protein